MSHLGDLLTSDHVAPDFLDLNDLVRINRARLYKEPKVSVLQANGKLVQYRNYCQCCVFVKKNTSTKLPEIEAARHDQSGHLQTDFYSYNGQLHFWDILESIEHDYVRI